MYDLRLKLWLVKDGQFLISDGRAALLSKIKEHGSLSKAAEEMGMSYRHAWGIVQRISENAGGDIVSSTRGGREGGVSTLTELGERLLREYDNKAMSLNSQIENSWRKPSVTADGLVVKDGRLLLVKRGNEPFKGTYALPGGFVEYGETLEKCVKREVREETGIRTDIIQLLGVYSAPDRDPRGHFVTAVYELRPVGGKLGPGDDAAEAGWFDLDDLPELAFDHGVIVDGYRSLRTRKKR